MNNFQNSRKLVKLGLAVESQRSHMSNEGFEIFKGLAYHGYTLCGYNLPVNDTNVSRILTTYQPNIVVINDKREWDVSPRDFREPRARFTQEHTLKLHSCLRLTILKDAHQKPTYHMVAAEEMGIDYHITYYDEEAVRKVAPWVGSVIRTYHTIDKDIVPRYEDRTGVAILSGAISNAYPVRQRLLRELGYLPQGTTYLPHPGYHRRGTHTPSYIKTLAQYRVAICTCSIYEYALRKLIEATAAGCIVITNLPKRYTLPEIDENLVRVDSSITTGEMANLIQELNKSYDPHKQYNLTEAAKNRYDYRIECGRLDQKIVNAYSSTICK